MQVSARLVIKSLFLAFFALFFFPSFAFAATTSFRSASIITTDASRGFINLSNCSTTDGLTCDRLLGNGGASLYFRGFGTYADFGIPQGSKITKVRIRVTGKSSRGVYIGLSAGKTFTENCQWPSDLWATFSSSNIITQTFVAPVKDEWQFGAVRSYCLQQYHFDTNNFIWRINYSTGNNWTANIDNLEIAFDYTPPVTPTPTPTATPSPTPTPTLAGPAPFLDLPWDYTDKKFTDEVFRINSYFDHEYPLIFSEQNEHKGTTLPYYGRREPDSQTSYSGHNGYDYDLDSDTPVLAAASGTATYLWDDSGGNTIMINHDNGYFTWYLHMLDKDLITNIPNNPVTVTNRQMIGRVGSTGKFTSGPHLHFSVIKDVNNNDTFDWNSDYPFGLTDPYKWRGDGNNGTLKDDPWPLYQSGGLYGSVSDYLWIKPTDATITQISETGGTINQNKLSLDFLIDSISATLNIRIEDQPQSNISDTLKGVGHTFDLNASDVEGNPVTSFLAPVTLTMSYANEEISNFIENTLSFFYFDDQQMQWIKMPSTIDTENKTVTTETTHFTQFTVMGELRDVQPPLATFEVEGDKGQDNWYRSDVAVSIVGEDNQDGLGIKDIFYSIGDDLHWQDYIEPIQFSQEGHYVMYARATDKGGNAQEEDSVVEFKIEKTMPIASIDANPKTLWPPNGKMVNVLVTGSALDENLYTTNISVEDEYNLVEPIISDFGQTIQLEAKREGIDLDGRVYILNVVVEDLAGNKTEKQVQVVVPHDQKKKK